MKNELTRFFAAYWYCIPPVLILLALIRYFALAGSAYWLCYRLKANALKRYKIQSRTPERKQIRREIRYSLSTAVIFTLTGITAGFLYRAGYTRIYPRAGQFGTFYLFISFIWLILLHDTYFYWTHRLLHTRWFLKHIHSVHHRSTNPTPWAAYAFHPLEALIESAVLYLFIMTLPVYAGLLIFFTFLIVFMNVMGHLGYEFYSRKFLNSFPGKHLTSSTHHNLHHQVCNKNFGYYFTWWDRWMKTLSMPIYERHRQSSSKTKQHEKDLQMG